MMDRIVEVFGLKTFEKGRVIYAVRCGSRLLGEVTDITLR